MYVASRDVIESVESWVQKGVFGSITNKLQFIKLNQLLAVFTMTKFSLSIGANNLVVFGQWQPFGFLFLRPAGLYGRDEHERVETVLGVLMGKCYPGQQKGKKQIIKLLHVTLNS